jgi:hypothetical protein
MKEKRMGDDDNIDAYRLIKMQRSASSVQVSTGCEGWIVSQGLFSALALEIKYEPGDRNGA